VYRSSVKRVAFLS